MIFDKETSIIYTPNTAVALRLVLVLGCTVVDVLP
jgi:hypothetical protein